MNYVPIRRARPNQPNGDGIDWGNPATKGLVFLSNASVPGVDMSCPRTKMTTVGNVVSTASGNILTGDTVSSTDSRYYDVHNRNSFTVFGESYLTDGGSVRIAYWNSYGWAIGASHWSANQASFGIGGAWAGSAVAGGIVSWATNKPQPFAVTIDYQAMIVTLYISGMVAGQWAMTGDLDPVQSTTPDAAHFRFQNKLKAGFSHVGVIAGVSPFAKSLSINPGQVFL